MLIQEIKTNALDLAGGELIKNHLDNSYATLVTLNVLDTMMIELSNSRKQFRGHKVALTLEADVSTGEIDLEGFALDVRFVRWRRDEHSTWNLLDIVQEIEDLTRAENSGQRKILFQGTASPITYFLSWTPREQIDAELWGKAVAAEITDLNESPPFPPEFSLLAAYRIADFCLNQLLLIGDGGKTFGGFVIAQKKSLYDEHRRCQHVWYQFLSGVSDLETSARRKQFNILDELDRAAEDEDTSWPSDLHFMG